MKGDAVKAVPTPADKPRASGASSPSAFASTDAPSARKVPVSWMRWAGVLRSLLGDPAKGRTGAAQLAVGAVLVVPVWLLLALGSIADHVASGGSRSSIVILSMLAGELAFGAALMSAIRAWVSHEIAPVFASSGLCAYGVRNLAEVASSGTGPGAVGRVSLAFAFAFLFLSVVRRARDNHQRRSVIWASAVTIVLLGMNLVPAKDGLVAAAWAVAGVSAIWLGRQEGAALKIWIGFAMLCLAQGRVASAVIPETSLAALGSHVLLAIAMALTLLGTVRVLQESIGDHQALVLQSLTALRRSEARRRSEEHAHQEAVHNLRSAVAAIGVATDVLLFSGQNAALSNDEKMQLAQGLEVELERARRLIAREWAGTSQSFSLLDLLMPAVVKEQTSGALIDLDVQRQAMVRGDPNRAYEVVDVLFDNARRHAGGTPLTIRSINVGGWVTLMVGDRGPGLLPGEAEQVFERGWTTARDGKGAGLGLYLARRLMEEQGGTLVAANRPGGGAVFLARFPKALSPVVEGFEEDTPEIVPGFEDDVVGF